jgi:outer membrane protein assembly factor BamE
MRYFILVLALLVCGCASYSPNLPSIKPYKLDIQQGNVVTPKMMLQLRPGMTKTQVRFIMGTSLLTDTFHADRWDYFYQMNKDGKVIEQRRIILEFEGDFLQHVRGDVIATGKGDDSMTVAPINEPKGDWQLEEKPAKKDDKGLLDKLKFWQSDEKAKAETQPKVEPAPEAAPNPTPQATPESTPAETPAPATEKAQEEKPAEQPAAEKKSLLDKLKFWKHDEEPKAAPAIEPKVESTPPPAVEPAPAPVAEPKAEAAPLPEAAPEPKSEATPQPPVSQPEVETTPLPEPVVEPKVEPTPESAPAPKVEPAPEAVPPPKVEEPAPAPQPKVEELPQAEPVAEPKVEELPQVEPAVEPKVEPIVEPKVEAAPETKAEPAPQPQKKGILDKLKFWGNDDEPKVESKPKPEPPVEKAAPQPKDLPPEDAPDYFEKMLEKIGF